MRSPLLPSRSSMLIPRRFGSENIIVVVSRVPLILSVTRVRVVNVVDVECPFLCDSRIRVI